MQPACLMPIILSMPRYQRRFTNTLRTFRRRSRSFIAWCVLVVVRSFWTLTMTRWLFTRRMRHSPCRRGNSAATSCSFRPLHDRVVVTRIDAEDKTAGGIIIPDTAKEKPSEGEVISVGPGGRDEAGKIIPIELKVGDRVLFGKWSGTEVKIDGVEYLIMKESDIMGVIEQTVAHKKAA